MNNYKKFAAKFCGVELLIIALANIVYYVTVNSNPRIPFVTQDSPFVNESPVL